MNKARGWRGYKSHLGALCSPVARVACAIARDAVQRPKPARAALRANHAAHHQGVGLTYTSHRVSDRVGQQFAVKGIVHQGLEKKEHMLVMGFWTGWL